uniref:N-acetyltransferase domain-containing protein n=1 Tax=Tetradesmus obliquus TaxID=3088 RepID=A0A383VNH7_TETOB|eukprot:jgi/Sobl393_1/19121/SZX66284.1
MAPSRKQVFVCATGSTVPAGTATHALALLQFPTAMSFKGSSRAGAPPFAWMGGNRHANVQVPPLARMANRGMVLTSDELLQSLLSDNVEEPPKLPQRRGHSDEWYQERCVFCCGCKETINSQFHKRGSRCHGCRRWFHTSCMPAGSSSGSSSLAQQPGADVTVGGGSSSSSATTAAAGSNAAVAQPAAGQARQRQPSHGLFFHSDDCKQVHSKLAAVAAAGEQPLPAPARRGFRLPWQQQQPQQELQLWRLLDLSEVRPLYKDAQRRGTLFKQHAKVQKRLAEQQLAVAAAAGGSSVQNTSEQQQQQQQQQQPGAVSRRVVPSRLDDFLVVSELLRGLGDTPKDLLQDSFALITRTESGQPTCAATFNIFGDDHARLQGLVTPQAVRRQGHAARLVQQLECVLQGARLQQLAVVLAPDGNKDEVPGVPGAAALERWLLRAGFKLAAAEQAMLWRRELPEYHRNLVAGCSLLVKPLGSSKGKRWF